MQRSIACVVRGSRPGQWRSRWSSLRSLTAAALWLIPAFLLVTTAPAHADICGDSILDAGEQCDDGNTADGDCCSSGCAFEAAEAPCQDDGNACTTDACDGAGTCVHDPIANGSSCSDGDLCTQVDVCVDGSCVGSEPITCTALDGCHDPGVCDPASGLCSNPLSTGGEVTFAVEADTYTDSGSPATNYGGASSARVDADPERRIYLRFSVTGMSEMAILSAILRMETTASSTADSDDGGSIYPVSDNGWDEGTMTHENRPVIDGSILSSVGPVGISETVDFDVTAAISGDGTYSFAIVSASENMAKYRTKEASQGHPQLILSVAKSCDDGDACTQTDICVEGACVGTNPLICTGDACNDAGACDPATGLCTDTPKANGTACDDGDACTQMDTCEDGACIGSDPVICTSAGECYDVGVCDPATGLCVDQPKANGTACDDTDACTQTDTCQDGTCVGSDPVACTAEACHVAACDPVTGLCTDSVEPNGTACDDGDACTQTDTCVDGICVGGDSVTCAAPNECQEAGACDPATGTCVNPFKANGTACDDGNACTQTDMCVEGACVGSDPVTCTAQACHAAACDPATGLCVDTLKANGTACDDGNACTQRDICEAGTCLGTDPITCPGADACHLGGTCDPATGTCSRRQKPDGTPCDDGNLCSAPDVCISGACTGTPLPDTDEDGFCDATDVCPFAANADQSDDDRDGIGNACQCTAPAPGRCIAGGGSKRNDCLMEFLTAGPVLLNAKGNKVKPKLICEDGDPACDLDGMRDGTCTFGVSICFGNTDPRFPRCTPDTVSSVEVLRPAAVSATSSSSTENATALEDALGALGLEVRRKGQVIADSIAPVGNNFCSPPVELRVPAPQKGKGVRSRFVVRAKGTNKGKDKDRFLLVCE